MKQIICGFILSAMALITSAQSNIQIADNRPGADLTPGHVHATLTAAIGAASSGDSIFVVGSGISHGAIIISDELYIFGAGHHPDPAFSSYSELGSVNFTDFGDGSVLSGFRTGFVTIENNADNIEISDCWMTRLIFNGGSGYLIEGNFIAQTTNSGGACGGVCVIQINPMSDAMFRFNIFQGGISNMDGGNPKTIFFDQNLFLAAHWGYGGLCGCSNLEITNSIFLGASTVMFPCTDCVFTDYVEWYWDAGLTQCVGNDPLFENWNAYGCSTNWYNFENLTLDALSPAKGAGNNNQDLGVLDHDPNLTLTPYDSAGYPPLPRISKWVSPTKSIQAGGTIQITIDAYSNN